MKKTIFLLILFVGTLILSSFSPSHNSPNTILQNDLTSSSSKKPVNYYVYFEFEFGGCQFIEEIFINDEKTGGYGFISRNCGEGWETIGFTIKKLKIIAITAAPMATVAVESIDDIQWESALPEDIDNYDFYSYFLERTNEGLATIE